MIVDPLALNAVVLGSLPTMEATIASLLSPSSSSSSDLSVARADDPSPDPITNNNQCTSAVYLNAKGNLLKDILVICRGLPSTDGKVVADCDEDPWKSIKPSVRPSNAMLRSEVTRRWDLFVSAQGNVVEPRCKSWTMAQCNTWLDANAICTPADVAYLQATYARVHLDAVNAAQEAVDERRLLSAASAIVANRGLSWIHKAPYIRLIHCLIDSDEIRSAFLRRNTFARTRLELDGRNAADAPLSCWEMMAILWNDPTFCPKTYIVSMHEDFSSEMSIPYDEVAGLIPATAESCKEKITNMLVNLGRIISRWERSGQGDGGFEPEDDDDEGETCHPAFGSFADRSHGALASRGAFLRGRPSYLLYLWHHLEENDLVASAVARIDPSIAGPNGASGVPSVLGSSRKKKSDRNDMEVVAKSIRDLGHHNEMAAKIEANMTKWNNLMNIYLKTKIERSTLQLKIVDPATVANDALYAILMEQVDELQVEILDLKKQMKECDMFNKRQRTTED